MVTLTEQAAKRVKIYLARRGKGLGIRVGIKTTGCSGLAYVLEYVDKVYEGDNIFESQGVHIYVDKKSLVYLNGIKLDWIRNGINEGFEFTNPNEKSKCGCGESFSV
jgi:iron-sulfur cluster assembly protein